MLKQSFLTLVLLFATLALQAQTQFHDNAVNEVKGKVKSITTTAMGLSQTITFTSEGKMQQEGITAAVYDTDGYLQSYSITANGHTYDIKLSWENGVVKSQDMTAMGQTFKMSYQYDDKGNVSSMTHHIMGQENPVTTINILECDPHNNWIRRSVTVMGVTSPQTRTIEYYE